MIIIHFYKHIDWNCRHLRQLSMTLTNKKKVFLSRQSNNLADEEIESKFFLQINWWKWLILRKNKKKYLFLMKIREISVDEAYSALWYNFILILFRFILIQQNSSNDKTKDRNIRWKDFSFFKISHFNRSQKLNISFSKDIQIK